MSSVQNKQYSSSARSSDSNECESSEPVSKSNPIKIFNISKIANRDIVLMRNKIPKVFWIQKFRQPVVRKSSSSPRTSEDYTDTPIRRVYGGIYKIERFPSLKKRVIVRQTAASSINNRICNDYSENVSFKIQKVQKQLIKPFALKRYPNKKVADIDSASTKRSSRESSKQKGQVLSLTQSLNIEAVNLTKVDQEDVPVKLDLDQLQAEPDLFMLNQAQNEELKKDIQALKFPDHLEDVMGIEQPELHHLDMIMPFESMSSYHEEEFEDAYNYSANDIENEQLIEAENHHYRHRGISGCNDFNVIEVTDNNCFLFGNERETPNFEPFVTNKLFSVNFDFENKPL